MAIKQEKESAQENPIALLWRHFILLRFEVEWNFSNIPSVHIVQIDLDRQEFNGSYQKMFK